MLSNYLKIALRHLVKRKGYAFINIFGLAVGLACGVLILLFVQDELSYDRFHADAGRVYRVSVDAFPPGAPPDRFAIASQPVGRTLRADFPEIEHVARFSNWNPTIKHDGQFFYDDTFFFAEPTFFQVFSFPFVEGSRETALAEPYRLVLTREMARKYFGDAAALGKTMVLNDTLTFTVGGVVEDVPATSHFTFDFLASYATLVAFQGQENDAWLGLGTYTYVKLKPGTDADAFAGRAKTLIMDRNGDELRNIGFSADLVFQPLTEIHLHSDRMAELDTNSDIRYVYVFSAVAVFVLLIACINFMNLATARSMERAKEVGVRKVAGSGRGLLVRQFLAESILMCVVALVVALVLIAAALPFFNDVSGKEMSFARLLAPGFAFGLLGLTGVVGVLAGSYPAFVLSGFRPIDVLKGAFRTSTRGALLRKGLVVFQFTISVALIVATAVVFDQLRFMRSQQLGFEPEQVVVVDAQGVPRQQMRQQFETVKREFEKVPSVEQASATWSTPGRNAGLLVVEPEGLAEGDSRRMQILIVDHDFTETLGLEVVAGRDFDPAFETDVAEGLLINETAVKAMSWGTPEQALGKRIGVGPKQGVVVGVVKDFHFNSLKEAIEPAILHVAPQAFSYFALRVRTDDVDATLAQLEETWKTLFPGFPFESFFLDEDYDRQYEAETRLGEIFGAFAFIAILIACLGLFGLATFMAEQRTKEIGIRKVMGASVPGIVALLSKDFTRLVVVSVVVASPLAYFGMERWLETFPYRVSVSWTIFAVAGASALFVALATVSYQSVRAALTDPVRSLRYE